MSATPTTEQLATAREAQQLLGAVATTLNELETLGVSVRLHHGIVATDVGYVIPTDAGVWQPRLSTMTTVDVTRVHDD